MRYLVDESNLDTEISLNLYRLIIRWVADHSDRFVLSLQSGIYSDPEDERRLRSLGEVMSEPEPETTLEDQSLFSCIVNIFEPIQNFVDITVNREAFEIIKVRGIPSNAVVEELTRQGAPQKAISGDLSPAEDIEFFIDQLCIYGLYDYGRTQVLDLTDSELEEFRRILVAADIDPKVIIEVPKVADISE